MVVALGGPGVLEPRSYTERYLSWQINDPSRSPMRGTVMKKIAAVITTSVLLVSVGNAAASAREAHSRGGDRGTEVTRVEVPEAPEVEAPETDAAVEAPEAAEVEAPEVDAAEEAPEAPEAAELEAPEVDAAAEAPEAAEAAEVEVPEVDAAADEAPEAADAP